MERPYTKIICDKPPVCILYINNVESVRCVNKEKDNKCGAMERPRTRFMRDRRLAYC